jgi:hypothetical protein
VTDLKYPEVEVLQKRDDGRYTPRGSGHFIGGRLILTADFVVKERRETETTLPIAIRPVADDAFYDCEVLYAEKGERFAILEVADPSWGYNPMPPMSLARLQDEGLFQCVIGGFRVVARHSEFEQVRGRIKPAAFSRSGLLAVNLDEAPSWPSERHGNPWRGFAGAAVICGEALVGIVVEADGDRRLLALPATRFAQHGRFKSIVRNATGQGVTVKDIDPLVAEDASAYALQTLATADAANTQEVAASQLQISNSYYQSVLSQARRSFTAALISAGVGFLFFLGAVIVALNSQAPSAAVISTLSGAIVEVIAGLNFWLYARTASQLETFHVRLDQTQRFLLANSVATNLSNDEQKDRSVAALVRTIAGDGAVPTADRGNEAGTPPEARNATT